jgi:type II secretory pathway pseudopilin PulG
MKSRPHIRQAVGRWQMAAKRPRLSLSLSARRPLLAASNAVAFTLIELLISIALALVLILGVNAIFKYTTQAVGQGQAVNAATRDSRSAQTVFNNDFTALVPNGTGQNDAACIIIRSSAISAFRDRADELSDKGVPGTVFNDPKLTIDINGDGTEGDPAVPGEVISPATYNYRNHRTDVMSFFARSLFARQTGNLGTYVAPMSSQEAWIWYGHLWLPNNSTTPGAMYPMDAAKGPKTFPGAGGSSSLNPNNYYASQFVLGRVAVTLLDKTPDANGGMIGIQRFIDRRALYPWTTGGAAANEMDPFRPDSSAATSTGAPADTAAYTLQNSRFDLAATTISSFNRKLQSYIATPPIGAHWWEEMMDGNPILSVQIKTAMPATAGERFQCNPYVNKPLDAAKLAQTSPYFLQGCSQFIVEFAGDFVTQDNDPTHTVRGTAPYFTQYGDITNYGSDGQLDFAVVNGTKQIIWYGMPRNTSGAATTSYKNGDVVPLQDWLQHQAYLANGLPRTDLLSTFEKDGPTYHTDYTDTTGNGISVADSNKGYICAWGPNDIPPKLIRITINLTDSTGRLPDGLTYQYVFPVPAQ